MTRDYGVKKKYLGNQQYVEIQTIKYSFTSIVSAKSVNEWRCYPNTRQATDQWRKFAAAVSVSNTSGAFT